MSSDTSPGLQDLCRDSVRLGIPASPCICRAKDCDLACQPQEARLATDPRNPDVSSYIKSWRIPYDPGKFPNKWWKLRADAPVRTLMAHLGKDSYSHIHFDSEQARTITVREAARLQSFPDGFIFKGSMNPAFKQIGNAVPPLFAYAIARGIRECLGAPRRPTCAYRCWAWIRHRSKLPRERSEVHHPPTAETIRTRHVS